MTDNIYTPILYRQVQLKASITQGLTITATHVPYKGFTIKILMSDAARGGDMDDAHIFIIDEEDQLVTEECFPAISASGSIPGTGELLKESFAAIDRLLASR